MRVKYGIILFAVVLLFPLAMMAKTKVKPPLDFFNHEKHTPLFEGAKFSCENCHADPASYGDREKINKQGCHLCHNSPNPPLPGPTECTTCHEGGQFPEPESHKVDWLNKHQSYAKQDSAMCTQCHENQMFCINCHERRDTVQEQVHKRNFKLFHAITARANPRKCATCHKVDYCTECHSGEGSSKR